jgi:hypothetical protein
LRETDSSNWNMSTLLEAGKRAALEYDDISLVGLAARAKDPVMLAALRESVILYAEKTLGIGGGEEEDYEYVWRVDKELQLAANRFIDAFNNLVAAANLETELGSSDHESGVVTWYSTRPIPTAEPDHAAHFYTCCKDNEILGRCAHLGTRQDSGQKYHWAIRRGIPPSYVPVSDRKYDDAKYMWAARKAVPFDIDEFWSEDIWTTERYRSRVW